MVIESIFQGIGGLALFLFGIGLLSKGMEKYAGAKMQKLIERLTNNRIKSFSVGMFASASLQSSSLVMVTMIGMINAGLMGLNQGIGIILGFEVGTTLTAQIVAFDIGIWYLAILAVGFFVNYLSRKLKRKFMGQALLGFGILFMGMSFMKDAMIPLRESAFVTGTVIPTLGANPVLGVLIGILLTALIQSSSATVGILIAMGASGAITLPVAVAIALGANVGTCITGILASIGGSRSAKQAVTAQIIISSIGAFVFVPVINPFADLVAGTAMSLPRQIANAHAFHNIFMSMLLLPFTTQIARLVRRFVPGDEQADRTIRSAIGDVDPDPGEMLSEMRKEVMRLGSMAEEMLLKGQSVLLIPDKKQIGHVKKEINGTEDRVNKLRYAIENQLTQITGPRVTTEHSTDRVALLHNAIDLERVADLAINMVEHAEELSNSGQRFTPEETETLRKMIQEVNRAVRTALEGIERKSQVLMREVRAIEQHIDDIDIKAQKHLLRNMDKGLTKGRSSAIFLATMRDLERVGDHADNIAKGMLSPDDSEIKLAE